jgi:anti-sigma factor RsiW
MKCPPAEVLHDLVSGDLTDSARMEVIAHVRGCAACKLHAREFLVIYSALHAKIAGTPHPTDEVLVAYVGGRLDPGESQGIRLHLEECARCKAYTELAAAPVEGSRETDGEKDDLLQQGYAGEIGRAAAADALAALMPGNQQLLGLFWERVSTFIQRLGAEGMAQWPIGAGRGEIAGALGFAGVPDPEIMSAAIIMATSLSLAHQIEEHHVAAEPVAVRTAVRETATRLGAGKELVSRLSDVLSTFLLR